MTVLFERRAYQNPEALLISLERQSCAGCLYYAQAWQTDYCKLGLSAERRCKSYDDGENGMVTHDKP